MASSYWDVLCKSILYFYKKMQVYIRRTKLYDNSFLFLFFFVLILSLKHDDIEINPGPNKKYQNVFHVVTGM